MNERSSRSHSVFTLYLKGEWVGGIESIEERMVGRACFYCRM